MKITLIHTLQSGTRQKINNKSSTKKAELVIFPLIIHKCLATLQLLWTKPRFILKTLHQCSETCYLNIKNKQICLFAISLYGLAQTKS